MKVICISPLKAPEAGFENAPRPEVGDIDEVINITNRYGEKYYSFERFGISLGYHVVYFATLSSHIDETTLVNHKPEPACH
jgi:hypothetical protein